MFVAVGCDWTTELLNTKDAWCDGVYGVVYGTGKQARVAHIHGSMERLLTWLARVHDKMPNVSWTAFHVDAKTLRTRVLCQGKGKRILGGKAPLSQGRLCDVLRFEMEMLGKAKG